MSLAFEEVWSVNFRAPKHSQMLARGESSDPADAHSLAPSRITDRGSARCGPTENLLAARLPSR
jgi:hypothetical protein